MEQKKSAQINSMLKSRKNTAIYIIFKKHWLRCIFFLIHGFQSICIHMILEKNETVLSSLLALEQNRAYLDGQVRLRGRTGDGGDYREGEGVRLVRSG